MGRLAVLKGREGLDGLPGFRLGQAQLIETLQIEPELCAPPEEMGQAQSRVACLTY